MTTPSISLPQDATSAAASKAAITGKRNLAELDAVAANKGTLLARAPVRERPAAFNSYEREMASREFKNDAPSADRWAGLQRMKVNAWKAAGKTSSNTLFYAAALQEKLQEKAQSLDLRKQELTALEANGWSKLPGTRESRELPQARARVTEAKTKLNSVTAEVDKFLNRPESSRHFKPINESLGLAYYKWRDAHIGGE